MSAHNLRRHGVFMARAHLSRRDFVRTCALSALAFSAGPILGCRNSGPGAKALRGGAATWDLNLEGDWLFGGKANPTPDGSESDAAKVSRVTLPHCVAQLSWQNWTPARWADIWVYRRHFAVPRNARNRRVFLEFNGVMTGAAPTLNGRALPRHLGGYLPFGYEITDYVKPGDNLLELTVDGRWQSVPPDGSPRGPAAVDYLEPAAIHRPVKLRVLPSVFIQDIFAKPLDVLEPHRRVEIQCTLDAAAIPPQPVNLKVELMDGERVLANARTELRVDKVGPIGTTLTLENLGNIGLWAPSTPRLYDVVVTLIVKDRPWHEYRTRLGFREARFEVDGFFLNGQRFQIFGLDRHEIYPYVGAAMSPRVKRRDAQILRNEFNCNFVRCSHYPQSEAFLDACDELGLMVWEEPPGWQYIGDEAWQDLALRDVEEMVRRDRNRPSIVIWGVRINESANHPDLYRRTKAAAKALDGTRPTSGAMNRYSTKDWVQDVYALDDYHSAPDGTVGVKPPIPGVPYFLTEGVGQFAYGPGKGGFGRKYRRAGDLKMQEQQAVWHAQIHDRAQRYPRIGGVVAWCAFDYASLMNSYNAVKCPGVADVFRVPKLGAAFYQAQVAPSVRPVIQPDFYWDFGPTSPAGPGDQAALFSNCERLEIFVNGRSHSTLLPDRKDYPHLKYPPFFANLSLDGSQKPELRIDGFVGDKLVLSRSFSADPAQDQLSLVADDTELIADGSDSTRLVFRAVDKFGAPRPFARGEVVLELNGPGTLIGDNPFQWDDSGGVGAVWIRTLPNRPGQIVVTAAHERFGRKSVAISVRRGPV
jgi:beta-galactosidase